MADLTLTPDYVYSEVLNFNTLTSSFENGYEQRRAKWSTPLRRFRLTYKARTISDFQTIRDFFLARLGSYDVFTFTNPNDSVVYNVRFVEDSLSFDERAYNVYDFSFDVQEVK